MLNTSLPGLEEILDALVRTAFEAPAADAYEAEIGRAVGRVIADRLMALAAAARWPRLDGATLYPWW